MVKKETTNGEELEKAQNQYFDIFEKEVPPNKKNDIEWIYSKIDAEKEVKPVEKEEVRRKLESDYVRVSPKNYESLPEEILKKEEFKKMTDDDIRSFHKKLEREHPNNPHLQIIFKKMVLMKRLREQPLAFTIIPKDVNSQGDDFWHFSSICDCDFWIKKGVAIQIPMQLAEGINSYYNFTPEKTLQMYSMNNNTLKDGISKFDALL